MIHAAFVPDPVTGVLEVVVLNELIAIAEDFQQLLANLGVLREFHEADPRAVACLEAAENFALKALNLLQVQIEALGARKAPGSK